MAALDPEDMSAQVSPAVPAQPGTVEPPYDKYAAQSDMRTLQEAAHITKSPHRMKHARRAAQEKLADMNEIKKLAAGGSVMAPAAGTKAKF